MSFLLPILLLFIGLAAADNAVPDVFISLSAVVGRKIALPCDISSPKVGDEVYLVLWYKDESTTPIYSVDARKGKLAQARHSSSDNLAHRTYFSIVAKPTVLEIDSLVAEDEGEYRCRVDFRKARTRHSTIYLQIIVPPGVPIIKDQKDKVLQGVIGPYNEGDRLLLICESEGGRPLPSLTWWKSSTLLDDTYEVLSQNRISNELEISVLNRLDLMAAYICQASNNNISVPTTSSVKLDMNFKPLQVKIEIPQKPLSANKEVELVCMTTGSRPSAVITWRKGNVKMKAAMEKVSSSGSVTTSTLIFTPISEDNGKSLYCHADNLVIPSSAIEDVWKIQVHFVPELKLRLGSKLRHSNIQERNDVYFDCNIRANPWVTDINWKFDNQELHTNISAGIIVSNQTLVLQRVQRHNRGKYSCTAANTEGQSESNHVHLRVQFAPVCKSSQKTIYGAILHRSVKILCEVEADPEDITFRWEFNNTLGNLEVIPFRSSGTQSIVNYIPRTEHDFGTLFCWGKNDVGVQRHPCVYTVMPAGLPGMVQNCSIHSETENSFSLHCDEGDNGGLAQHFYMEIRDESTHKLHSNISSDKPDFIAQGLPSGTIFLATIYSSNAKGNGPPFVLRVGTLPIPESQTQKDDVWQLSISPTLLAIIAVVAGLVSVALFVILYVKTQSRHQTRKAASQTAASCKLQAIPRDYSNNRYDMCVCVEKENEKLPILITSNGIVTKGKQGTDGDLVLINSNCVGWRNFQTFKSKECDLLSKSGENVNIEEKEPLDCSSSASPVSSSPSLATSPEEFPLKAHKNNTRNSPKTSPVDENKISTKLISNKPTEV